MRVLHVSDCYLPRLGGIETHVHDLSAVQRAAGLHVGVLTATAAGDAPATEDEDEGAGVLRLPARRLLDPRGAALRSALTAAGPDVVHVHSSVVSPLAWAAARQAHELGLPVVATLHSLVRDDAATAALRAVLGQRALAGTRWTAVSRVAARPLQQALDQPVSVLHNGIDPAAWRPEPGTRPAPAGERRVVTLVSALRFARRKRPHALLRMLAAVREAVPADVELRAVLLGDGPMWAAARRRVRALGMAGWVELPGRCSREQVRRVLAGGDVYLAPARLESFGLAALEARCAGLTVVAFAGSGVEEFVRPGVEGFLARDDDDMAAVVARVASQPEVLAAVRAHNLGTEPAMTWPAVLRTGLAQYAAAGAPLVVPWPRRTLDLRAAEPAAERSAALAGPSGPG